MNKKKTIALACALVMAATAAGCSGKTASKESETVTLSWYVPLSAQADMAEVMDAAAELTVPKINARLDLQCIDASAFTERMNMNMASGSTFDMTFTGYVNPYLQAVKKGGLMDITDLIDESATELKAAIPDYAWEAAEVDGRLYAVPNLQGFAPSNSLLFLKKYTDKYQFDVDSMQSMEDLESYLKQIKDGEPGIYPYRPYYDTMMWYGDIYEIIESNVAIRADGSSPEVFFIYDTPEYQQALKTLHSWYEKGYIRSDYLSAGNESQDAKAGKYAVNNSGWLPGAEESAKISNGNNEVIIKPMMKSYLTKEKALATMIGIGADSKNAEKSIQMIELLNTDKELYNLISYGLEGKHYTKGDNGKVTVNTESGYVTNSAWMFGNQFNAYILEGQDDDVWEKTEQLNQEAVKSPLLGFVLDTDPIKNEISQISAVDSEYNFRNWVVNGTDNWEAYMSKLEQAGSQKVLDEIQKQVNAYWESK